MRFLMKVSLPVERANAAAKDGSLAKTIQSIVAELNPEAAYFATDGQGRRCGYLFFYMQEPSQIPAVAEPWFLAFNAAVEIVPAMKPEDLSKAEPHFKKATKKYGGR
jgi:hypothetical protein